MWANMRHILSMRSVILAMLLMLTADALAQNSQPEAVQCWKLLSYRRSTWSQDKSIPVEGMVYVGQKNVQFDSYDLPFYFTVTKFQKFSDDFYSIDLEDYDETYNHMEVRKAYSSTNRRDLFIILGQQDEEGNMHSSIIINCRNLTATPGSRKPTHR